MHFWMGRGIQRSKGYMWFWLFSAFFITVHDRTQFKNKHTISTWSCGLFLTCRGENRISIIYIRTTDWWYSFFLYNGKHSRVCGRCRLDVVHSGPMFPVYWYHQLSSQQLNIYRWCHHSLDAWQPQIPILTHIIQILNHIQYTWIHHMNTTAHLLVQMGLAV
jgi:hypothetical protein